MGRSDGLVSIQCYFYIGRLPTEAPNLNGYLYAYVSKTKVVSPPVFLYFWMYLDSCAGG